MNEYPPRIHDDEVAHLPLQAGRADLLEDIMATPVIDRLDRRPRRGPAPAWFAVPAAAAAVAAIALVPVVRSTTDAPTQAPPTGRTGPAPLASTEPEPVVRAVPGGKYVALDAAGWKVGFVYEGEGETDIAYQRPGLSIEMVQYPADAYDSYYEDRLHVSDPAPSLLLGKASATFTYSADDHATIRPAEDGRFLEVRGSGMDLAAYHDLLDMVVQTDASGLADSLPEDVVTPFNRDRAVAHLLEGVDVPEGFTADDVRIEGFNDAYQSAATVAGSVGCAWLDVYAGGGAAARRQALAALDGSRDWPLLKATVRQGDYAEVFWEVADRLRAGDPVAGIRQGIC